MGQWGYRLILGTLKAAIILKFRDLAMTAGQRKHRGTLTKWHDDRGFGFIKPDIDEGDREVFLHITALRNRVRRPRVGGAIFYEQMTGTDGKVRASNASIEGVASRPLSRSYARKPSKENSFKVVSGVLSVAVAVLGGGTLLWNQFGGVRPRPVVSPQASPLQPKQDIQKSTPSIDPGSKASLALPRVETQKSPSIDPGSKASPALPEVKTQQPTPRLETPSSPEPSSGTTPKSDLPLENSPSTKCNIRPVGI
jgi:cold shock CspA family protein